MLLAFLLLISFVWLLAVYKVFILDDGTINSKHVFAPDFVQRQIENVVSNAVQPLQLQHFDSGDVRQVEFHLPSPYIIPENQLRESAARLKAKYPARSATVAFEKEETPSVVSKTDTNNNVNGDNTKNNRLIERSGGDNSKELTWPPVLPDGTIPVSDGYEIMPITKLQVPRFWSPPEGTDLNKIGSHVNGEETIFLMIASYRDFQCRETITSAFQRSDHPERLFIGAVDQVVAGDTGCLDIDIPCSVDANQPICKYRDQISIYKMDASIATGPVTARHIGDRMYRGQYYVMQMDAHCLFVRHWDTKIIKQFKSTKNEMAVLRFVLYYHLFLVCFTLLFFSPFVLFVSSLFSLDMLSSYLTDVQGSLTPAGDSTRNTRPIMCNSDFEGAMPARYLRHGSQPEDVPEIKGMPQLQPFWAAGFSFSRGHFKVRVPYDGYQPMVFQVTSFCILLLSLFLVISCPCFYFPLLFNPFATSSFSSSTFNSSSSPG
jgi:hypothetical protein